MWFFLFVIFLMVGLAMLIFFRMRDQKYLKKKTSEALGEELKKEIEEEKALFLEKKTKFEKALERARLEKAQTKRLPHKPFGA